jgi:hypothetical protein
MHISDKQRAYLNSIALECAYMKRDYAIGLPGDVSQYMVKKCIKEGLVEKVSMPLGVLADGRKLYEDTYWLTGEGKCLIEK